MPKKISRAERKSSGSRLSEPRKIVPPHKRKKDTDEPISTSSKKISDESCIEEDLQTHYRIIDFMLVFSTLSTLVSCQKCAEKVSFQSCKKEGLGFKIKVICEKCKVPNYVPSCEKIKGGSYEINYRFAFVMRTLGLGSAGCDKFCGLMDLGSSFVTKANYCGTYLKKMSGNIRKVTTAFLKSAVEEEKKRRVKQIIRMKQ